MEKIRRFALEEAGFDLVGFSSTTLPAEHEEAASGWVENGFAGRMDYMAKDTKRRAHPERALAGAKSVISLAVNYYHPEDPRPRDHVAGKVAKYAYGVDYHKVIEKKLKRISNFIKEITGPQTQVKSYVDTGPILEKAFAKEAGLGFFGKNTNLITKEYGSWVFLASLITDLELEVDPPHTGACGLESTGRSTAPADVPRASACGSCRICIDACPTGALLGNYTLDARKCISYLTIESKEPHPEELKEGVGEWFFGCDICQDVCPYNHRPKVTRTKEFYPEKKAGTWVDLETIKVLETDEAFSGAFQGSPLKRPKLRGLKRNAETVKGNVSYA